MSVVTLLSIIPYIDNENVTSERNPIQFQLLLYNARSIAFQYTIPIEREMYPLEFTKTINFAPSAVVLMKKNSSPHSGITR